MWPHAVFELLMVGIHFPSIRIGHTLCKLLQVCHVQVGSYKLGVICASYGVICRHFQKCEGVYYNKCFASHPLHSFEVTLLRNINGNSLSEVDDEIWFKQACPRDYLCCPFQCPNCQSQNIPCVDLDPKVIHDQAFECLTIRSMLNAFLS